MNDPLSAAIDTQRRGIEAMTKGIDVADSLPETIETMNDVEVGQTPSEVVYEENKLELLHYDVEAADVDVDPEDQHDVPMLVVYALINRPYILDLQPNRSVIRRLLEAGHDVYFIDWNDPSRLDQHLTLDDYVNRYIDNCVDVVREESGRDAINVLGYCMGGTMSTIYTALYPEKVNALGLMAAGLHFEDSGGILEQWGDESFFDARQVHETLGNVPQEFLDEGFALMDPVDNYVSKYLHFLDNLDNERFVENFARMEKWLADGVDVAGATYAQFLEEIYQANNLANNELYLGDEHVDIENIEMPVLQIVAEYDHLVPPTATKPFNDLVPSEETEIIEYATGHVGLAVSRSSHADVWPEVCEWFEDHSNLEEDTPADSTEPTDPEQTAESVGEADADSEASVESGSVETSDRPGASTDEEPSIEEDEEPSIEEDEEPSIEEDEEPSIEEDEEPSIEEDEEPSIEEDEEPSIEEDEEPSIEEDEEPSIEEDEEPSIEEDEELSIEEDEKPSIDEEDIARVTEASAGTDEPIGPDDDIEVVDGIGPTYANRLREAGIDTAAHLQDESVETIADVANVSTGQVRSWLDQIE